MSGTKSRLSVFLQEVRGKASRQEFQEELDALLRTGVKLPFNYVSLVERGAREKLRPEFLEALSRKTGKTRAELEAMHERGRGGVRGAKEPYRPMRIVSGHTAWAAGLIGAVLQGVLDVELATCSKKSKGTNLKQSGKKAPKEEDFAVSPEGRSFTPDEGNANWIKFSEGSISPMKNTELLDTIANPILSYHFNARDALDALDGGWADIVAVPVGLVERSKSYVRLARLVASEACCVLIANCHLGKRLLGEEDWNKVEKKWRKHPPETWDITTRAVGQKITKESRIGAEHATIGQLQVSEICQFVPQLVINANEALVEIDSRKVFATGLKTLNDLCISNKAKQIDAVVLWEPHATWLLRALAANSTEPHAYIALRRSPDGKHHRTPMFEFDLVIRADKTNDALIVQRVKDLLLRIATVSEDLPQFREDAPSRFAEPLARYFGIGQGPTPCEAAEERMRVIGPVGYDVSIRIDALHIFLDALKGVT